jgi:ATP-dependent DNA helicase RecG
LDLADRESILDKFRKNSIQVLVTTTVIEVGVDVPNASVMIVEGADKFGLTQLHQLRGRVGRSIHKSYCFLFVDSPTPQAAQRLSALETTKDGFAIAEQDLLLRGPGEFFGTAQAGLPRLRIGRLLQDMPLLQEAREEVSSVLEADPFLETAENRPLRELVIDARSIHL